MNVILSSVYDEQCRGRFQLGDPEAVETVTTPDSKQEILIKGKVYGFFLKSFHKPFHPYFVIACAHKEGDDWLVDYAFILLPSFPISANPDKPFLVFQEFIHLFGLLITIGNQVSQFIVHEEFPIDDPTANVSDIVRISVPEHQNVILNLLCEIDKERSTIICDLAFALDAGRYLNWLLGVNDEVKPPVIIRIAPLIARTVAPLDLLASTATIRIDAEYDPNRNIPRGILFNVLAADYCLEVGCRDRVFYIIRNADQVLLPIDPIYRDVPMLTFYALWGPTEIGGSIISPAFDEHYKEGDQPDFDKFRRVKRLATRAILPPNSLLDWARKR